MTPSGSGSLLHVGQQATTLSGGEAQRVKLPRSCRGGRPGALYLLDEPTTGLHFHDVQLLEVLHKLVDQGNSVVVIEHNLEVVKTADWVVDLGPEGGDAGGEIVATGTPEDIVRAKQSYTGSFLKDVLKRGRQKTQAANEAVGIGAAGGRRGCDRFGPAVSTLSSPSASEELDRTGEPDPEPLAGCRGDPEALHAFLTGERKAQTARPPPSTGPPGDHDVERHRTGNIAHHRRLAVVEAGDGERPCSPNSTMKSTPF